MFGLLLSVEPVVCQQVPLHEMFPKCGTLLSGNFSLYYCYLILKNMFICKIGFIFFPNLYYIAEVFCQLKKQKCFPGFCELILPTSLVYHPSNMSW